MMLPGPMAFTLMLWGARDTAMHLQIRKSLLRSLVFSIHFSHMAGQKSMI